MIRQFIILYIHLKDPQMNKTMFTSPNKCTYMEILNKMVQNWVTNIVQNRILITFLNYCNMMNNAIIRVVE